MILAQLIIETSLAIVVVTLVGTAIGTLFTLWTKARETCVSTDKTNAEQIRDQMILNERSVAAIALRDFERDQLRRELDRCERELDRWKPGPVARTEPTT